MRLVSTAICFTALSVADTAWALSTGFASNACPDCHHNGTTFDGSVSLTSSGQLEPGQPSEFTLHVEQTGMMVTGFFVSPDPVGTLDPGDGNRIENGGLVHSMPASAMDGAVDVNFTWTPPTDPGGADFAVNVVAANDNHAPSGDVATSARFSFAWGCEPLALYEDIDADGFGNPDGEQSLGCGSRTGWSDKPTDCNDLRAIIYPGATELANGEDDNCDGSVDEGVEAGTDPTATSAHDWYPDADSDGYGFGLAVQGDVAPTGYVSNADDCDDANPDVSPVGYEFCDGKDDDCNGQTDEGFPCGSGECKAGVCVFPETPDDANGAGDANPGASATDPAASAVPTAQPSSVQPPAATLPASPESPAPPASRATI
jgi:hypothetical protein